MRRLSFVKTVHQSSTQQRDLPLDGIVGRLLFPELPASLQTLFLAMELLHLGQSTAEGCGAVALEIGSFPPGKNAKRLLYPP